MSARPFMTIAALWKVRALLMRPGKILRVFRDDRTPFLAKILPLFALIYIFFPLDLAPDFVPFLGQIDDLTIALMILSLALGMVPEEVFRDVGIDERHRKIS